MKDASQQQTPFRKRRTQIEQECFHQDCQMIPIILPSGDIPVRTLSPGYNLTILFSAEKHLGQRRTLRCLRRYYEAMKRRYETLLGTGPHLHGMGSEATQAPLDRALSDESDQ